MLIRTLIAFVIAILLSSESLASSGWLIYYERAFKGKVIDAKTKEPIEGAVVVAIYHVRLFGPILPIFSGSEMADVQETITDSQGNFFIPSNFFFYPWPTTLGGETTTFVIFKPGYGSFPWHRVSPPMEMSLDVIEEYFTKEVGKAGEILQRSQIPITKGKILNRWNVTFGIVELPKLKTREERRNALPSIPGANIPEKKIKNLLKAIDDERLYLYGPSGPIYNKE